jgi:hypothetical protein
MPVSQPLRRPPPEGCRESRVFWFVMMEEARNRLDFEGALRAKRELERLGVRVSYRPKHNGGGPSRVA